METVWNTLIAAIGTTTSPLLLAYLINRNRRAERQEDYARQDAVAKQAAEAARLLLERQDSVAAKAEEAANLLLDANERVAATAQVTIEKLDVIHTLVNSNMTAAVQAELDATVRELAMMYEVIDLKRAAGKEPGVDALAAVKATTIRIAELRAMLADRLAQGQIAADQTTK